MIDALCARKHIVTKYKKRLIALKQLIDKKIEQIEKDPKQSYEYVKKYLGDISYEDYLASLRSIEWINNPSDELLQIIEPMGYKQRDIIK